MMETQNVTLALPKELIYKAKRVALERRTSISGLLTQALAEIVAREDNYAGARQRHLDWLERGADLGTKGEIKWRREDLHGR
jgi:predicted transcriptional regulator